MTAVPRPDRDACPVLLTPAQVGDMFRVDSRTVRIWAEKGWLTPRGGWPLRFAEHEVRALLAGRSA